MRTMCWIRLRSPFFLILLLIMFMLPTESRASDVEEVLSVATGQGPENIGNQFLEGKEGAFEKTYAGFVVSSGRIISLSDVLRSRVVQFAVRGRFIRSIYPKPSPEHPGFWPSLICSDADQNLYVYDASDSRVIRFSEGGDLLSTYPLKDAVAGKSKARIRPFEMKCNASSLSLAYEVSILHSHLWPIYDDRYSYNLTLLDRHIFEGEAAYIRSKAISAYVELFTDERGNHYGAPLEEAWGLEFLPLTKISKAGKVLCTIDGPFLTANTGYTIYDYYSMKKRGGWGNMKGNEFLIMNWYVDGDGTVYALVANNDCVKVLQVKG